MLPPTGLISASAATGAGSSYGALVRHTIGTKAETVLQWAVLANCYIMEVVFVVVLGDILIGTAPDYGGVLPEWTGRDPAACFWLRRDVVLAAISLLVLLPLALMRSMAKLAVVNIIGGWVGGQPQRAAAVQSVSQGVQLPSRVDVFLRCRGLLHVQEAALHSDSCSR